MTSVADKLLELLDIEQLEVDMFRGLGSGGETTTRIFGGQVIAQALMAAYRTVEDRLCHSLHAYFIRPGDPSIPVIYQVDRARDGGSFTTRRVVAIQHGKQIFNLSASFHVQEDGWDYQHPMRNVGNPEDWPSRAETREAYVDRIPEKYREEFLRERPIELREVAPRDMFDPEVESDVNQLWFRMEAAKGQSPQMQHCLLAYASDMNLLGSSLRPHGLTWFKGNVMTASLDHAMWFHAPIEFSDWHLYDLDAPWTGGARGFNRGAIYSQNGQLVASVAQEGLMRPVKRN
ncbi:acyl-CoA thioesterase II [Sulfitobacter mediterraneus]|uniref:acyl-CoA thioesterase n=1 Tax=Sulfitobacter mediterraneus TaxID=83219 RepID=UPI00193289C5|nr:acyl-CoA thioesterase II [Sulfitobacter mediterraneus]MBM1312273.1 acyl-CoA thioesterase II [Sulfitobacter mediterraneus]MBM1316104.1 acyl-CoA thioesterase II [Sulfitobacter mediterraneus]MBM1324469.1 acyl-CoA thioesterase II [Sulfitobacter mediterraneus]MBM1328403.1 acyl-CoA thioesterase II [Sulfitobacter mediterraneus]MBM1399730.1 acyl-CoA thioesterase II [Sulfitobacter mediterraneus]